MKIVIRKAEKSETKRVADLLLLAWPLDDYINESKGISYQKIEDLMIKVIEADDTLYNLNHVLVAEYIDEENEKNNKVVGALCGYDGDKYEQMKKHTIEVANLSDNEIVKKMKETEGNEFYLDAIGVDEEYRGHGVAKKLMNSMMKKAKKAGFKTAGLIVDIHKTKAEELYTKLGFKFTEYRDYLGQMYKHMSNEL